MTIMDLSRKTIRKIDLRDSRLKIGILVIMAELFMGLLCLVLGIYVVPFILGSLLMTFIIFYPKIGIPLMIFLMPGVEYLKYNVGNVSITPFRVLLIPTAVGVILHIAVYRSPIRLLSIGPPIIGIISIAVISILQSSHIGPGVIKLVFLLSLFFTTFVLAQSIDSKKWVKITIWVMMASSTILITEALSEAFIGYRGLTSIITSGHRLFGVGGQIGALYATTHLFNLDLNTYMPFALILAATSSRLKSIFLTILLLLFILGIVLSAAMAGWLAAFASLTTLVLVGILRKQHKTVIRVLKLLVIIVLLAGILLAVTLPTGLGEARFARFFSIISAEGIYTSRTAEIRIPVGTAATHMFIDHPILGVGLGSMGYEYYKYLIARVGQPKKVFSHTGGFNVFVDFLAEMGIIGIIMFLWFIIAYARLLFKYLPLIEDPFLANMLLASCAASVAAFLHMQTESGPFWANNFWVIAGLSLAIINISVVKRPDAILENKT